MEIHGFQPTFQIPGTSISQVGPEIKNDIQETNLRKYHFSIQIV